MNPKEKAATAAIGVTNEEISDILSTAFEGGSNYWYANLDYDLGEGYTIADFKEGGRCQYPGMYHHWCQLVPLVPGCAIVLEDAEEGTAHRLDRAALVKGVQVMAEKYPQHFANWLNEDGDAITGDVFLQCCVFGENIYS